MAAVEAEAEAVQPESVSVSIRNRKQKTLLWGLALALSAAAMIAGIYLNVLQVNWHIHIPAFNIGIIHVGEVNLQLVHLKKWWDGGMGFIKSASWALYRHGLRDDGEPALAVMVFVTLMAKAVLWDKKVSTVRMVVTPILLPIAAAGLILGAIWLQFFGLPELWHYAAARAGHPHFRIYVSSLASVWAVTETFAFGASVSHLLRPFWAPVGAKFQGKLVEHLVDAWWRRQSMGVLRLNGDPWQLSSYTGPQDAVWSVDAKMLKLPFWVRHVGPPPLRDRFVDIVNEDLASGEAVQIIVAANAKRPSKEQKKARRRARWMRRGWSFAGVTVTYLVITGFIAHYWIGRGHNFPYLAPHEADAAAHAVKMHAMTALHLLVRR